MHSTILCIIALAELFSPNLSTSYVEQLSLSYTDRLGTCIEVANAADMDPIVPQSLAVAVAFEESKFDGRVVSRSGAHGAMQVIPFYSCPDKKLKGCDLVKAGIVALHYWIVNTKNYFAAACKYNAGNVCSKAGRGYARRVTKRVARLRAQMKNISYDFETE